MTYNLHPIIVHFPIALLLVYSLIKIFPWKKYFPKISWKHIEVTLLIFGVLGSFLALNTGETAEHLVSPNRQLVNMHALFANISTWLYGLLLLGEILSLLNNWITFKIKNQTIINILLFTKKILTNTLISKTMAILGLVAISTTGLLGGVMVYGLTADPIAPIVLHILGITY